jgi:hypothetical protein
MGSAPQAGPDIGNPKARTAIPKTAQTFAFIKHLRKIFSSLGNSCLDEPKWNVLNPFRSPLPADGGEGDAVFRSTENPIEAMLLQTKEEKQADFGPGQHLSLLATISRYVR